MFFVSERGGIINKLYFKKKGHIRRETGNATDFTFLETDEICFAARQSVAELRLTAVWRQDPSNAERPPGASTMTGLLQC